jgi:hypothetical protein
MLTTLPSGVQMTLVSATMPTSLTDILNPVIEVYQKQINSKVIIAHNADPCM